MMVTNAGDRLFVTNVIVAPSVISAEIVSVEIKTISNGFLWPKMYEKVVTTNKSIFVLKMTRDENKMATRDQNIAVL